MSGNIPYIGSKISLITTSDIRYEGILYTLNREESTIAVQNVRSFGTEGRRCLEVPMSNEIYDFIIFRGKDLKDLTVLQGAPERSSAFSVGSDPFLDSHSSSLYSHGGVANDHFAGFPQGGQPQAHLGYQPSHHVQAPPPMAAAAQRSSLGSAAAPRNGCIPAAPAAPVYPAAPRPSEPPPVAVGLANSRPAERPPMASSLPGGPSTALGSSRTYAPAEPPPPSRPPGYEDAGLSQALRGPVDEDAGLSSSSRGPADEAKAMAPRAPEPKDRPAEPKEQKARGRGKGGGQRKPLYEVLRFHKRAEEAIVKMMRSQGSSSLQPSELRATSEVNPSVYHFYLDFVNYCCPTHMVQSDDQQWESVCKALQKHFEKEFGAHQSQKPPQPQRPNNTLGDFITIETNSKASKKGAKVTRGGGRVGRGAGRGGAKKDADEQTAGDVDGSGSQEDGGSQPASWACPRCTLRNEDLLLECVACGTSKQQAALWVEFPPLG
uniref:RanBP2-type domain-containing protein n=1 Tax=Alexandrium monilatum TaxID=311494 RepID=A0A7S4UFT9_9DINO|mmetsp:Transcript_51513/g.161544  ORF Transcript_51513/g.161544 Transcript_51513/m.161544 type:complete len:491 (+) Transcript_51513:86-1558(+)